MSYSCPFFFVDNDGLRKKSTHTPLPPQHGNGFVGDPPPPSPGTGGAVPLAPALLGLLRFVLSSHLAAPDPALPLSPSYCSRLLLDDDDDDLLEKLAAGLARCVEEGRLPVAAAAAEAGIPAGEAWSEEREREWEAVVLEKGNELKRVKLHLCLLLIWLPFMAYFVDNMK